MRRASDHHLRPADDRRERQPAAVPGQHHPAATASIPIGRATGQRAAAADAHHQQSTTATSTTSGAGHHQVARRSRNRSRSITTSATTMSLSGVYLCQKLVRARRQLLPRRALRRAQLSPRPRIVNVFVLNNTYILNPTHGGDVPLRHEHVQRRQHPAVRVRHARRSAGIRALPMRFRCRSSRRSTLTGYTGTGLQRPCRMSTTTRGASTGR